MKIRILAAGKLKASPMQELCREYLRRMHWDVTVKETDDAPAPPDGAFVIALDERGETYASPDFARQLEKWRDRAPGNTLTFMIGPAEGFDETAREKAKILLSFGKQTWPHMMVRVMLLEQIYRAQQILAGHPSHKV